MYHYLVCYFWVALCVLPARYLTNPPPCRTSSCHQHITLFYHFWMLANTCRSYARSPRPTHVTGTKYGSAPQSSRNPCFATHLVLPTGEEAEVAYEDDLSVVDLDEVRVLLAFALTAWIRQISVGCACRMHIECVLSFCLPSHVLFHDMYSQFPREGIRNVP